MNLKARIEALERKYPDIRSMEAECIRADGRCDWLSLEELKQADNVVTILRFRNCSLPGLDKWLQFMKEAAQ